MDFNPRIGDAIIRWQRWSGWNSAVHIFSSDLL
ncbi:uncharacterized protein G2W53_043415 [Senna tora]|uniref:Uncharacterized protein n=1 Tax=Senna tora TaxID=362788 RepID=A0A834W4X6_9FABA|nr:uncharacterized protein G2W53_043415 [Senna tora]